MPAKPPVYASVTRDVAPDEPHCFIEDKPGRDQCEEREQQHARLRREREQVARRLDALRDPRASDAPPLAEPHTAAISASTPTADRKRNPALGQLAHVRS